MHWTQLSRPDYRSAIHPGKRDDISSADQLKQPGPGNDRVAITTLRFSTEMPAPRERVDCGFSAIHVSTGEGAESKRAETVRELYGRTIMRCEIDPLGDEPVRMDARLRAVGDLGIAHVAFSAVRLRRTAQLLFDDMVVLSRTLAGSRTIGQRGREVVVAAGEAILTSGAEVLSDCAQCAIHRDPPSVQAGRPIGS